MQSTRRTRLTKKQKKKKEDKLKFKHTSGLYLGKIVSVADIVPHIRLESTLYQNNFITLYYNANAELTPNTFSQVKFHHQLHFTSTFK